MSFAVTKAYLESKSEPSEDRICHRCGYLLIGHSEPARCPECDSVELPQNVVRNAHRAARWWRVAFVGPFVSRSAGESLWNVSLGATVARSSRYRAISVLLTFVLLVVLAGYLSTWWVYKLPTTSQDASIIQRSWWYEYVPEVAPTRLPKMRGQTPYGEVIAFGSDIVGWKALPLRILGLFGRHIFEGVVRAFGIPWAFLLIAWPILCANMLGSGIRRAYRLAGMLLPSFIPFLVFIPVVFLAKLAYMFFWIDFSAIPRLVDLHIILALWPGIVYTRYAMLTGTNRWSRLGCAVVTGVVVVGYPICLSGMGLYRGSLALSWI